MPGAGATVLINVGLPRTSTQSFDRLFRKAGYRTSHIGYGERDVGALQEFKRSGRGKIRRYMAKYQVLSDSPYYGLIPSLRRFYPDVKLVATHRSKASWLKSMGRNPGAGGAFLRKVYGKGKRLSAIYDAHYLKCRSSAIPLVSLERPDREKLVVLSGLIGRDLRRIGYPRTDPIGERIRRRKGKKK